MSYCNTVFFTQSCDKCIIDVISSMQYIFIELDTYSIQKLTRHVRTNARSVNAKKLEQKKSGDS